MDKFLNWSKKRKLFYFFVILSPSFWFYFFNLRQAFGKYLNIGRNLRINLNIFPSDKINYLLQMRSLDSSTYYVNSFYKRLLYNKLNLVIDKMFSVFQGLSPNIYFVPGDYPKAEFIPLLLLPFWFAGLIEQVVRKNTRLGIVALASVFFAGIFGEQNIFFLMPTIILYIYLSYLGFIKVVPKKYAKIFCILLIFYSIFLNARMFLIR